MEQEDYKKSLLDYEGVQNMLACTLEDGIAEGLKRGLKEGMEKGLEKGMEEGLKEGMEKGMEKGIEKGKMQVAQQMIAMGMAVPTVAKATGLSEEEVGRTVGQ